MTLLRRLSHRLSGAAALAVGGAGAAFAAEEGGSGMPQLNPESYASQIFWLAVSFLVLFFLIWKVALPRLVGVIEDRRNRIDSDLERASTLRAEAEETQAEYEKSLAEGRSDAQAEIRKAMDEAAKKASEEQAKLAQKLAKDIEAAEGRIAEAREAAVKEVQDIAAEAAQAAADQLVGIKVDKKAAKSAVSQAIKEVE